MADASVRLPLPAAYADPAFFFCMGGAVQDAEVVGNFERLNGVRLVGSGDAVFRRFAEFVHDCIYARLPDDAINSLRTRAFVGA